MCRPASQVTSQDPDTVAAVTDAPGKAAVVQAHTPPALRAVESDLYGRNNGCMLKNSSPDRPKGSIRILETIANDAHLMLRATLVVSTAEAVSVIFSPVFTNLWWFR